VQVLSNTVIEEVDAVVFRVGQALALHSRTHRVNDTVHVFSREQISDLAGRQQIVEVDKEALVGDLALSEEEAYTLVLNTRNRVVLLQIGLEVVHAISGTDHDTYFLELADEGRETGERLLTGTADTD
jgi:hypothetical protein